MRVRIRVKVGVRVRVRVMVMTCLPEALISRSPHFVPQPNAASLIEGS